MKKSELREIINEELSKLVEVHPGRFKRTLVPKNNMIPATSTRAKELTKKFGQKVTVKGGKYNTKFYGDFVELEGNKIKTLDDSEVSDIDYIAMMIRDADVQGMF